MTDVCVSMLYNFISEKTNNVELNVFNIKKESYRQWAMNELLNLFIDEYGYKLSLHSSTQYIEYKKPVDLINEFIDLMDYYSTLNDEKEANMCFCIAKEVGEEIKSLFIQY